MEMHEIEIVELPAERKKLKAPQRAIGLVKSADTLHVLREALESGVFHIVQKLSPRMATEVSTSRLMIERQKDFIAHPLAAILRPDEASAQTERKLMTFEFKFDRAAQKDEMLSQLAVRLTPLVPQSHLADIQLIGDELFTNAVFNAPYTSGGAMTNSVSRNDSEIQNRVLNPGRVFAAVEGATLVLGCEDAYGSLDVRGLLARLARSFEDGVPRTVNLGRGGAGLGTFMVLNACNGFYAAVEKQRKTVVCALLTLKASYKSHANTAQHIHISESTS